MVDLWAQVQSIYVCVCGTLLAKGMHVLFLPSLFPLSPLVSCHPFRTKNKERQQKQSVPTLLGLGHPDEEIQQSIRNCKETGTDFFHFHPCVSLTGQREKLRLHIKNYKRSAIGSGRSHKTGGRSVVTLQVCMISYHMISLYIILYTLSI